MRAWILAALVACSSSSPHGEPDATRSNDAAVDAAADAALVRAPRFAYVANYLAGISAFEIGPNGELTALDGAPFDSTVHFYAVAVDPSHPRLYAADYGGHTVRAYAIQPGGTLAAIGDPVTLTHPAVSIAVDPRGRFVYVGDFDDAMFTDYTLHTLAIDASGALAPLKTLPRTASVTAITAAPDVVYTSGDGGLRTYAVGDDGSLAELEHSPFGSDQHTGGWIAIHPTANVLYTARGSLAGFAAASTDGALRALDGSPFATGTSGDPGAIAVAVDPGGRFACAVDMQAGTLTVYALASDGSIVTPGTAYDAGTSAYAVAIDPDGRFVYVTTDFGNIAAFAVDPSTLALTARAPLTSVVGNQPEIVIVELRQAERIVRHVAD